MPERKTKNYIYLTILAIMSFLPLILFGYSILNEITLGVILGAVLFVSMSLFSFHISVILERNFQKEVQEYLKHNTIVHL